MKVTAHARWRISLDESEQYRTTVREGYGPKQIDREFQVLRVADYFDGPRGEKRVEVGGPIVKKDGTLGSVVRTKRVPIADLPDAIRSLVEDVKNVLDGATQQAEAMSA